MKLEVKRITEYVDSKKTTDKLTIIYEPVPTLNSMNTFYTTNRVSIDFKDVPELIKKLQEYEIQTIKKD